MLRIFFTSRSSGDVFTEFSSLNGKIISIDMNVGKTSKDIEAYVSNQMEALSFEGEETRQQVIKKILHKSAGVFFG